jgi:hypothetical protein
MIKRKGEELAMVLLKEKMEIIKYELKYKQQVQNVFLNQHLDIKMIMLKRQH